MSELQVSVHFLPHPIACKDVKLFRQTQLNNYYKKLTWKTDFLIEFADTTVPMCSIVCIVT